MFTCNDLTSVGIQFQW